MVASYVRKSLLGVVMCLALAGCESDEERADAYFQSGMELLEEGDADRAVVQFRNAFRFEENHLGARMAMGNLLIEQSRPRGAYMQFLRVAEQYPEQVDARRILSELSFSIGNWDEFARHGAAVIEMLPDDPRVQAIDLGMKYRRAVIDEDDPARQALVSPAEKMLVDLPENQILNNLLLDSYARDNQLNKALARIDVLIGQAPDTLDLYTRRLALLVQMQDQGGLETQLRDMVIRFPGNQDVQGMLLRFYVSQERMEEAEGFLRDISDPADEDAGLFLSLIQFVLQVKGEEAARVEIERAIAENPMPNRFKAMLATMDFQAGAQDQAIADMEAILQGVDLQDPESQNIQTMLAQMLASTGNQVAARQRVEQVLEENPSNSEALKMQASWQLQVDETDAAIANLRIALDTAPDDVQAMNLMYEAYTRTGETDLARDYLAQAVDVSGNAPAPSLRYARLLINEERYRPAEDVLLPALRQNSRNVELLNMLGELYLRMDDIPRATQAVNTLNRIDTEQSRAVANNLQVEVLNRERGTGEALSYLEDLAAGSNAGLREQVLLLRARLQIGEVEEALQLAQALAADNPDSLELKLVLATTHAANSNFEDAEAIYREITELAPQHPQAWMQLARIARLQGDEDASSALIEEALVATERNGAVLFVKASLREQEDDIDGAIAIYEEMYEQNSNSVIVANNLASLLATYKDDKASLDRAWVVGRRLQGAENPALQDTYGWLLFRRGDVEEAVPYLESAASALDDPIVAAHLGFAYAALERNSEALEQMQKAVDLAGPADTRDRIEAARAEITRLRGLAEN